MKKAKTSKGLQILLSGLMVLVFAFTVGFTFCASLVIMSAKSNPYSTTTYAGMQQHTLINDTVDNPIPFGYGAHNFEVSLNYSYSYNFDVRFAYSIYWTDASGVTTSLSTDNVILLYANRDGYIVDDDYIYYVGTNNTAKYVSAGTGKLPIFTGVEFSNYEDERYFGATLTITIGDIKISKASSLATDYTTSHALVAGITEKPAAKAWLKYKNNANSTNVGLSEANAYAMVYNYRYKIENGIDYPKYRTAYKKVVSGQDKKISSVTWLGGNRFYAGMAVYIVTGNTPVTLTAKITNSWQSKDPINNPLGAVTDSNHFTNFATDWANRTNYANYTKTIPANSVAYIEIADSIEISCLTLSSETADFTKGVILSNINLNDGTFAHTEYVSNNSMLLCKEISANTMEESDLQDVTGEYSQKQIDIINSTVYSPLLYNTYEGAAETTKVNITVINNSAKKLSLSGVNYVAKVYISNGSPNIGEWVIITYTNSSWISGPTGQAVDYLAPFSSITIVEKIQVNYNLKTYIEDPNNMGGCYDAWIVIDVQGLEILEETSTTSSKLCAEASTSKQGDVTTVTLYAKNETKEVVNNLTINLVVGAYACDLLNVRPVEDSTTFLADYWKYYTKSDTVDGPIYSPNTSNFWDDLLTQDTYYSIDFSWTSLAISNVTTYNSFTNSGNKFTNTSYVLAPSERVKVATFTVTSTKECNFSNICFSGTTVTGGSKAEDSSVNFVNEGTSQAYIINNSTSSYYVRFTGSLSSTADSRFAVIGVYTYYIGLIRPGQILAIPMEATESAAMSVIQENDGVYASNTLNSWEADERGQLHQLFEAYFN